jgi:2-polyprenyl-3-methyl-5-hydroxy-6-metoxy-1,4-benzoquinol methylase
MPSAPSPAPAADVETSSDGYAGRFAGPAGRWMLGRQERLVLRLLKETGASSVLDVGGGHGQLAGPLARAGMAVTVLASDPACRRRVAALADESRITFQTGNLLALPYPDGAFDAVVSVRLVMHCDAWPALIAEFCRVARRAVVVDYPTVTGLNALSPLLFGAKKRLEKNTRTWRNFRDAELADAFASHGFRRTAREGQFFFPMVLHRSLQLKPVSAALEGLTSLLGLNRHLGSPVLARYERGLERPPT